MAGPDSGSCFTSATPQWSLWLVWGHEAQKCCPSTSSVIFILSFTAPSCYIIVCCVGHFKPLLEGSFHPVLLIQSRDVCQVNRCESAILSTSSVLFLLSFSQFTSSNNCMYSYPLFVVVASSNSCWKGDKPHKSDLGTMHIHFTVSHYICEQVFLMSYI